VQQYHL